MKRLLVATDVLFVPFGAYAQDNPFKGPKLTEQQQFLCNIQAVEWIAALVGTGEYLDVEATEAATEQEMKQFQDALEARENNTAAVKARSEAAISEEEITMKTQMYQGVIMGSVDKKQAATRIFDRAMTAYMNCLK